MRVRRLRATSQGFDGIHDARENVVLSITPRVVKSERGLAVNAARGACRAQRLFAAEVAVTEHGALLHLLTVGNNRAEGKGYQRSAQYPGHGPRPVSGRKPTVMH